MIHPTKLHQPQPDQLIMEWSDGSQSELTVRQLRDNCPCASCREKRRAPADAVDGGQLLPILSAAETQPLRIEAMKPVGNYAYHIDFSDGHNTGIYTFERLRDL